MSTSFVLYNSWWRNLVLALACGALTLGGLLASPGFQDKVLLATLAMFGSGTALFGYRLLDRSPQVIIDQRGVTDLRSRHGLVAWPEIARYRLWHAKGNALITLEFREPEKWLALAPAITQWLVRRLSRPEKFSLLVSLQNMAVNEAALTRFMDESLSKPGGPKTSA